MGKTLTKVGNSQAVIIPKEMVNKYKLNKIKLIEKDEGILIVPDQQTLSFQEKVDRLQEHKDRIYKSMKTQSLDPETIEYYENQSFEDVDVDIIDP